MIRPELMVQAFAEGGDKVPPPQTSAEGFVNFSEGYSPNYEISLNVNNPRAKAVERRIQNYMFFLSTQHLQAWQQRSIAPWYASMRNGYEVNAIVMSEDSRGAIRPYRSTLANNFNDPKTGQGWEYLPTPLEMWANIPMPVGGAIGSGSAIPSTVSNIRTLPKGTYSTSSDSDAARLQNMPSVPGSSPRSSMVEVFTYGPTNQSKIMRVTDRLGNVFTCGAENDTYTNWAYQANVSQLQSGSLTFAGVTSGGTNFYQADTVPAFIPVDGTSIRLRWHANNTSASQINVNSQGPRAILGQDGQPCSQGTIVANTEAVLQFNVAKNAWVIVSATSRIQVLDAISDNQAPSFKQVRDWVFNNVIITWNTVQNKPNVAINNQNAWFQKLIAKEVGWTDRFSGGSDTVMPNNAWGFAAVDGPDANTSGTLSLYARGTQALVSFNPIFTSFMKVIHAAEGIEITASDARPQALAVVKNNQIEFAISLVTGGDVEFWRRGVRASRIDTSGITTFDRRPRFEVANGTGLPYVVPYDNGNMTMVGAVMPFLVAIPDANLGGWAYADGRALSRTAYPELWARIGSTYGAGDGLTTFNIPDLRGAFIRGLDAGRGLDPDRVNGSSQSSQNLSHTHVGTAQSGGMHTHGAFGSTGTAGLHSHSGAASTVGDHTHQVYVSWGSNNSPAGYVTTANGGGREVTTSAAGAHTHNISIDQNGSHTHTVNFTVNESGYHTHDLSITASGGAEARPWNVAMRYYVYTGRQG